MKENADKARALDTAEIQRKLGESSEQMFRLRFQVSMGQMDGLKKLRSLRRERARMLTVLRERELHPENAAPKPLDEAKKPRTVKAAKPAKPAKAAKPEAKPKAAKLAKAARPAKAEGKAKAAKAEAKPKAAAKKAPVKKTAAKKAK